MGVQQSGALIAEVQFITSITTFFKASFSLGYCYLVLLEEGNEEEGLFPFPTFHNKAAYQP